MLEKNQLHTVVITDYSSEGLGVCHIEGQAVFVHGGVREETCEIRILKVATKVAWGKVENIEIPSPHRIASACPVCPPCGGCHFQHITYEEELWFKQRRIEQAFARIGGMPVTVDTMHGAPALSGYRNKSLFPVAQQDGKTFVGFFRAHSHDIIAYGNCLIADERANRVAAVLCEFMDKNEITAYDPKTGEGLVRHLFVRATKGVQVALIINGKHFPWGDTLADALRERVPDLAGLLTITNQRRDNVVMGQGQVKVLWGEDTVIETLGDLQFELHPFSFAQVNSAQAVRLYDIVRGYAALTKDDTFVDLFCGVGTITLWLARDCKAAFGVELVPQAVACARENAARNGIFNASFQAGDAGDLGAQLSDLSPAVVTVDPPRSGLDAAHIEALLTLQPQRIVYVSCDPGTLSRDCKTLAASGYTVTHCAAVDLFPRTTHVETVVLMSRVEK